LRVKKRKKYEKAQKKLSSTRAVYTGGQGSLQGGYSGESSGINTGVAKSRRFAN
jgi:U3 small nucleolar RNA-associated protein 3